MVKIILAALFILLVTTFSSLNREDVTLRYFFEWSTGPFPMFLLLLISLVVGLILGFSIGWGERWKLRGKARELGERVKVLRDDVDSLNAREKSHEFPPTPPEASKTSPS